MSLKFSLPLALCLLTLTPMSAIPQVSTANDGTGTQVRRNGDRFDIDGGSRSRNGRNQFHSFEDFGLARGQAANFLSDPQTQNILGRVVGGNVSVIEGLIRVSGSDANLFLINPAGMIFGDGARLDLGGSFTATTASGIGFDDNWFNAFGENDYADLVGTPNQFAFTASNPGAIINGGELVVEAGESIMLLGGSVINTGTLAAPGGTITVAGVPGENVVRVSQEGSLLSLDLEAIASDTPSPVNPIPFTPLELPALLSGGNAAHASDVVVGADGTVRLTGSTTVIPTDGGTAIASGVLDASSEGEVAAPEINVLGDRVAVLDGRLDASADGGGGMIQVGGGFQGQGPVFNAATTLVDGESSILADALEAGDGGQVIVWADGETGFLGRVSARGGEDSGNGGFVEISGLDYLDFLGEVDTAAPNGEIGSLLLDPTNIEVVAARGTATSLVQVDNFLDGNLGPGATTTINAGLINAAIADVTLQATNDITFSADINIAQPQVGLTAEAGNSIRVNADIMTAGGDVTLRADADAIGGGATSIAIANIETQGGDITVSGRGTTDINDGVSIAESVLSADSGDITLSGIGQGGGNLSTGITLSGSSLMTADDGSIFIDGDGGEIGVSNHGVFLNNTTLEVDDGAIEVVGIGGRGNNLANNNDGVFLINNTNIISTGAGNITLRGTGGSGAVGNHGLDLETNGVLIQSVDGDINLIGFGGTSFNNQGTGIQALGVTIQSTGRGDVLLQGFTSTENPPSNIGSNYGVQLGSGTNVRAVDGDLSIEGLSNGTGNSNIGILILSINASTVIEVSGSGKLSLSGSGGTGNSNNYGIFVFQNLGSASIIRSGLGGLFLEGVNQSSNSGAQGILINDNAIVQTEGGGDLALESPQMVAVEDLSSSQDGGISITASGIDLNGIADAVSGDIILQPFDSDTTIGIGDGAEGNFNITSAELINLSTTGTVIIGNPLAVDANGQESTLGNVQVRNIDLSSVNYDITIRGGNIALGNNNSGTSIPIISIADGRTLQLISTGSISEGTNTDLELGNDSSVLFDSATGIGEVTVPDNGLDIRVRNNGVANIAARTRISGDINFDTASRLRIASVGGVDGFRTANGGSIDTGAISIGAPVFAGGAGNITIRGFDGLGLNSDIRSDSGNITIINPGTSAPNFRTVDVSGAARRITTNGGTIAIAGGLEGTSTLILDAGDGLVELTDPIGVDSLRNLSPLSGLDIEAGEVRILADANLGAGGLTLNIDNSVAIANPITVAGSGSVNITAEEITVGSIDTSGGDASAGIAGNGGSVSLTARNGSITADNILTRSAIIGNGNAGNGGDITLTATDDINAGILRSDSFVNGAGTTGRAGDVTLDAGGSVALDEIDARSQVTGGSIAQVGDGGTIIIDAGGDVTVRDRIFTFSRFGTGNAPERTGGSVSRGGDITITTDGDISFPGADNGGAFGAIQTQSYYAGPGRARNSGSVTLDAAGTITLNDYIATGSFSQNPALRGTSGDVDLIASEILLAPQFPLGGTVAFIAAGGGNVTLDGDQINTTVVNGLPMIETGGGNLRILSAEQLNLQGNTLATRSGDFIYRNEGGIQISGTGQITTSSGNLRLRGSSIDVARAFTLDTSLADGIGGDIRLRAPDGNIRTGGLNSSGRRGGTVDILTETRLRTGNINASGSRRGGEVSLRGDRIFTGNITTTGAVAGGNLDIQAVTAIATGSIRTRATEGDGGNVFLDPRRNIEVEFIDARGGPEGSGGDVEIVTQRFFRATGTFGNDRSISTAGGEGGSISITHDGGDRDTPFTVGDPSINGTEGTITSGDFRITPLRSFPGSFTLGNIAIITTDLPTPGLAVPPEPVIDFEADPVEPDPGDTAAEFEPPNGPEVIVGPSVNDPGVKEFEERLTPAFEDYIERATGEPASSESPPSPVELPQNGVGDTDPSIVSREPLSSGPDLGLGEQGDSNGTTAPSEIDSSVPLPSPEPPPVGEGVGEPDSATDAADSNPFATDPNNSPDEPTASVIGAVLPDSSSSDPSVPSANGGQTDEDISLSEAQLHLQSLESQTGVKPALIYGLFNIGTNELELLLVTARDDVIRIPVLGAQKADLIEAARSFREELTFPLNRETDRFDGPQLDHAQQFYQWLIAPLQAELEAREIDNLVFLLDEGLRSLPLAALHDGQQFVIERYSVGLMPSLSLTDMTYVNINDVDVLAMGASEFGDIEAPLPAVEMETELIANTLWRGEAYMNEDFTFANLQQQRQNTPFGIVHLATHADFERDNPDEAYIQLWDTRLRLNQVQDLNWNNPDVELVVLSACRTALGDDNTELGFAGFSALAGVKSTLASLWSVDDVGTLGLMVEFYQQMKEASIKAEALWQAQLAMLNGESYIQDGQFFWSGNSVPVPPDLGLPTDVSLAHPYYWSGFTMVGSPW